MSKSNQLKSGVLISYLMIAINILLGLIYTPWILNQVGSSAYGLYTIASSIVALFLMDFGMSAAVTRFVSNYRAAHDQDNINGFVKLAIKFYSIFCLISAILLTVVYFNLERIYGNLTPGELESFKGVFLITAFFVVVCFPVNVCNGVLNAFEQFSVLKGLDLVNRLGAVAVTVIALMLKGGVLALIIINGAFNLLTFILKIFAVHKTTCVRLSAKKSDISFKEVFSFSAWSTVNGIGQQMIFNLIPSIVAMTANTLAVTMYGFANVIEGYVYTIAQAINGLFMPRVARNIKGEADARKVLPLMIKVGRMNQSVISLLIIGFAIVGREFVGLWVGDEYSAIYYCILFLIVPYFISSSQQIANTSIVVLDHIKYSTLINIFTGGLNLTVSYFVCLRYGVVGVCATIGLIFIIRIIALNFVYALKLKLDLWAFFKACHLRMLPGIMGAFVVSALITWFMPWADSWILLLAKGGIVAIVYFISMWFMGWNPYEKALILSFIPKFKKNK